MARPIRIEYPGALYHITSRGNAGEPIFLEDEDRKRFLTVLEEVVEDYQWICHAYCLMANHYHLLIETPGGNLSSGMRQLNGIYTQSFNRRHGRTGHIFQGRFKAILVEKETYLLELCRYIVLNPVRAGIVISPKTWKWSSYRATCGLERAPLFLYTDWILSQFGEDRAVACKAYDRFVCSGKQEGFPWRDMKGRIVHGSNGFLSSVEDLFRQKEKLQEIPRIQRFAARPSLQELLSESSSDPEVVMKAYSYYHYTLKEIGNYLGMHYATVSRLVKRYKVSVSKRGKDIAKNKT